MEQIERVTRLIGDTLGRNALGVYLHGSAVRGGLRPASDLDLLVVCERSLDDRERRPLTDGLLRLSGPGPESRSLELTVVVQGRVRPWRFPPTADFLYGDWLRDEIAAGGPPRPAPMTGLAIEIPVALAGDRALAGPPPGELLDPVPARDVRRASLAGIPALLDDLPHDTRNVILTLARIWTTLATGEIRAKDAAADWCLGRLPARHRPVLEHARRLYLTCRYDDESWTDELRNGVRPHVDAVLAEIDRLAAHQTRLRPPAPG